MFPVPLQELPSEVVERSLAELVDGIFRVIPKLRTGLVFLVLVYVLVRAVMFAVKAVLNRALPGESPVYRQSVSTIALVFRWFGVALTFLSIVGLDGIATSFGTATGSWRSASPTPSPG